MTLGNFNTNTLSYSANPPTFKAESIPTPLAKPIEVVQKSIEGAADTIVKEPKNERKKRARRASIAAGSSVLVLAGLIAFLNPKFASGVAKKLKKIQVGNANSGIISKLTNRMSQFGYIAADYRSAKDYGFKWLCTKEKSFKRIKNNTVQKIFKNVDGFFRKILTKPYEAITKGFDSISRKTVQQKYSTALKKMNSLEQLIIKYKDKLPMDKQILLESKLAEISEMKRVFGENSTLERLKEQERLMSNLENDFMAKWNDFIAGFKKNVPDRKAHFKNNINFWAENILQPTRENIEKEGLDRIEPFIGNNKNVGKYNEIIDILATSISSQEKKNLEHVLAKVSKKLKNANEAECIKYFDKKRDLILGGAPTDILTAVLGLSMSGILIANADNKEDKLSRCLTGVFPVIAGLGANLVFTAKLISGAMSLLYGGLTSVALSQIGSIINHYIFENDKKSEGQNA